MTAPALWIGPEEDPDRYRLGPLVGAGSEGLLYRGSITVASGAVLDVAVKMLHPQHLSRITEWRDRWAEQIELLRSVHSAGLAFVRDGFVGAVPHRLGERPPEESLYLVMNWVDGRPLDRWLDAQADLSVADRLLALLPVAAALDALHSGQSTGGMPVIHGDVKPGNILVDDEHRATLVDFGLVRVLPGGMRSSSVSGTPGYVAPEVISDGLYTPAADRYSLGAVAFFLLTGEEPPVRPTPEVVRAALGGVGDAAAARRVTEMLDPDPASRPMILANWCAQLRNSSLEGAIPADVLPPIAPSRNPTRVATSGEAMPTATHTRRRLLAGAAAVVALVVALAMGASRNAPPASERSGPATSTTRWLATTTTSTSVSPTTTPAAAADGDTRVLPVQLCANRLLGYQVEVPEELDDAPESELIGPCEAFGTAATSRLPMDAELLTQDLVFAEIGMDVHEFLTRSGQPPIERESLVAGHPAKVIRQQVTVDLAPSFPKGTFLYMYVIDLTTTTFVAQLAVPPSRSATFYDIEPALDRMMLTFRELDTQCADSTDSRCGPFYFDPPPRPNQEMTAGVTAWPLTVHAGDVVTFDVAFSDPDSPVIELTGADYGDGANTYVLGEQVLKPEVITLVRTRAQDGSPHGPWAPPQPEPGAVSRPFTHAYATPGTYTATFEARSSSRSAPLGHDPYSDAATATVVITVL